MARRRILGAARTGAVVVIGAACLLVAACSEGTAPGGPPASGTPRPAPGTSSPAPVPSSSTPSPTRSVDAATSLTLARKVGQLFMTGTTATAAEPASLEAITDYHVGNMMLTGRSTAGLTRTAKVVRRLNDQVSRASTGGTPLLVATDQEGGKVQVLRGPGFSTLPSALTQGTYAPSRLRSMARTWGRELRKAGVTMNLAPVMDTVPSASFAPRNSPIGALDREYGFAPATVAEHGSAFVRGMTAAGVATSIKHFPGLGRVTENTDFSDGVTDRTTTRGDAYLEPFRAGISAGSPFVMVSTAFYARIDPTSPAAFSRRIVTGMLRKDLGFTGVVISDDLSNGRQVAAVSPGDRAVRFIAAGGDLVLAIDPGDMPAMVGAVIARARRDPDFAAKVDAAAARVLAAKKVL